MITSNQRRLIELFLAHAKRLGPLPIAESLAAADKYKAVRIARDLADRSH